MRSLLYILETAFWTFVGALVMLFFYVFLIVAVFNYQFSHTDLPWGLVWPLIWGAMGVLILGMIVMAWWWGRMLGQREKAEQWLADHDTDKPAPEQLCQADSKELHPWRYRNTEDVPARWKRP